LKDSVLDYFYHFAERRGIIADSKRFISKLTEKFNSLKEKRRSLKIDRNKKYSKNRSFITEGKIE
jgi:hypothetical protein